METILTQEELKQAKEWLTELEFADVTAKQIKAMPDFKIERVIKVHFDGGIEAFKRSCTPVYVGVQS